MNALARASKQALQTAARGFASGAYPDRKVAVLGAAGKLIATCVGSWTTARANACIWQPHGREDSELLPPLPPPGPICAQLPSCPALLPCFLS